MSRKPYPTDICDTEWDLIKSMIPAERKRKRGKKRKVDMREVVNAIFYKRLGLLLDGKLKKYKREALSLPLIGLTQVSYFSFGGCPESKVKSQKNLDF